MESDMHAAPPVCVEFFSLLPWYVLAISGSVVLLLCCRRLTLLPPSSSTWGGAGFLLIVYGYFLFLGCGQIDSGTLSSFDLNCVGRLPAAVTGEAGPRSPPLLLCACLDPPASSRHVLCSDIVKPFLLHADLGLPLAGAVPAAVLVLAAILSATGSTAHEVVQTHVSVLSIRTLRTTSGLLKSK